MKYEFDTNSEMWKALINHSVELIRKGILDRPVQSRKALEEGQSKEKNLRNAG